jgi:DNA polymerase V
MPIITPINTATVIKIRKSGTKLPLLLSRVSAGFPSPADDYLEDKISFDEMLIKNRPATYLMKVSGNSMTGAGIYSGDLLVVDRSLKPVHNKIIVACVEGEFTIKRFSYINGKVILKAENKNYSDIEIKAEEEFSIFGVVTAIVRVT